jgi:ketosteroid isomerase-like protein
VKEIQIAMTEGQKTGNPDWGLWQSWLDAWNRRDLEGIVAHYADDVEFVSQSVVDLGMGAAGSLRGKSALRDVFGAGLNLDVHLVFTPIHAFVGVREHGLYYIGYRRRHVIEIHELDTQGKIIIARAYHGQWAV